MLRSDRAIIVSFILLPLALHQKGRRAAEIVRASPYAFIKAIGGNSDRLALARIIHNSCVRLVREGLLEEVGRVPYSFRIPYKYYIAGRPEFSHYLSPVYNLTEAGFIQALACADCTQLPDLRKKERKKRRRKDKNPYQIDVYEVAKVFIKLLE